MFQNPRYVGTAGFIVAESVETGIEVSLAPGTQQHAEAMAGNFGAVAAFNPPDVPPELVRIEAGRRMKLLVAEYSPEERETWPTQVAEAQAYLADPTAATPLLTAITAQSGETVATLAATITAKDAQLRAATGAILGKMRSIIALDPIPQDYQDDARW